MTTREAAEGSLGVVLHAVVGSIVMWWGQLGCLLEVLVLLLPPGFHREVSASLQREN